MWFDDLMENCKKSIDIAVKHKGVFVPVFLKLAMNLIIGVFIIIGVIIALSSGIITSVNHATDFEIVLSLLLPIATLMIVGYFLYIVLWGFIEVGSISLYSAAIRDEKPTKAHFFSGIKSYISKVFAGKLLIHFIVLISSPLLLVFMILYAVIVGIPTGGWGLVFLSTAIGAYFATWTISIVQDDFGAVQAIGNSFKVARKNFKSMFLIVLSLSLISQYVAMMFGPVGLFLAGWFTGGVITTYFRLIIYLTYLDYQKS